jgi:hypothetical protein
MMRFASAGPMRGNRSSASAGAVSRSRGVEIVEGIEVIERMAVDDSRDLDDLETLDDLCHRAESTASICRWSAG